MGSKQTKRRVGGSGDREAANSGRWDRRDAGGRQCVSRGKLRGPVRGLYGLDPERSTTSPRPLDADATPPTASVGAARPCTEEDVPASRVLGPWRVPPLARVRRRRLCCILVAIGHGPVRVLEAVYTGRPPSCREASLPARAYVSRETFPPPYSTAAAEQVRMCSSISSTLPSASFEARASVFSPASALPRRH